MLLDERGTGDLIAGAERLALIDRAGRRRVCLGKIDGARARGLRAAACGELRENGLRALADEREANIDHLDRLVGRMMGVAMLVERVECGSANRAIAPRDRLDAHR